MYLCIYLSCKHVSGVTLLTGDDLRQATIVMVLSHYLSIYISKYLCIYVYIYLFIYVSIYL